MALLIRQPELRPLTSIQQSEPCLRQLVSRNGIAQILIARGTKLPDRYSMATAISITLPFLAVENFLKFVNPAKNLGSRMPQCLKRSSRQGKAMMMHLEL